MNTTMESGVFGPANETMNQLSVTIMTRPRDWRLIWLATWQDGWDFRILCFCWRWEKA